MIQNEQNACEILQSHSAVHISIRCAPSSIWSTYLHTIVEAARFTVTIHEHCVGTTTYTDRHGRMQICVTRFIPILASGNVAVMRAERNPSDPGPRLYEKNNIITLKKIGFFFFFSKTNWHKNMRNTYAPVLHVFANNFRRLKTMTH